MNIVVTGTSRGIGLEFCRQSVERGDRVLALARRPERMGITHERLRTVAADVTSPEIGSVVREALKEWTHVDLLLNNAGVWRGGVEAEDFLHSFAVNSVAPFLIAQATLPWLKKSPAAKVVNVTSKMGSIADNSSGGYYAYRSSKAALNMITKSLAIDNDWLTCIAIHPGWVATDMGGERAPVAAAESVRGIWTVIENLKSAQGGQFLDFQGEQLPW